MHNSFPESSCDRSTSPGQAGLAAGDNTADAAASEFQQCEAVAFWLSHRHCVIVWRDGPQRIRPADPAKRIGDLRPGDEVVWGEQPCEILGMSVYR